jgi:hypothetical protein
MIKKIFNQCENVPYLSSIIKALFIKCEYIPYSLNIIKTLFNKCEYVPLISIYIVQIKFRRSIWRLKIIIY